MLFRGIAVDPLPEYKQEACQFGLAGADGVDPVGCIIAVHARPKMMQCSEDGAASAAGTDCQ
jgi:hypothetical protein